MKMQMILLAGAAALGLAFASAPASAAMHGNWGGALGAAGGNFTMNSNADSGGSTWGSGNVTSRYSWSGSTTNDSGDVAFKGSYNTNNVGVGTVSGNFDSSAMAGNGNYIETHGVGASSTGSHSGSSVSGSFSGWAGGGAISASGSF